MTVILSLLVIICGVLLWWSNRTHNISLALAAANPATTTMPNPTAIQGWLLWLIFNLCLSAVINFGDLFITPDTLGRSVSFVIMALAAPAAYFVLKKDRRGVTLAKWYFGVEAVLFALSVYVSQTAQGFDDNTGKYVTYLLKSIIWFTYLFVSKRVKAVYYPAAVQQADGAK
jgi:hypothetical protein